jgi:hypothetical protein
VVNDITQNLSFKKVQIPQKIYFWTFQKSSFIGLFWSLTTTLRGRFEIVLFLGMFLMVKLPADSHFSNLEKTSHRQHVQATHHKTVPRSSRVKQMMSCA